MRVYVEHDMTVCHVSQVIELKAGAIVESPLADYLVESDCDVTVERDDGLTLIASAPAPVPQPEPEPAPESHTPGSAEEADAEPGAAG